MDTDHSNSTLEKNELDVKKVLEYFFESKKIFISVSLIFALITSIHSFYLKSTVYHSSITLKIGQFDNSQVMNSSQIKRALATLFQEVFVRGSGEFIKLSYSDNSIKNAEEIINAAAELIISESNEKILINESKHQLEIDSMSSEIKFLNDELERINSIDKALPGSSGIESLISGYLRKQNSIEFKLKKDIKTSKETQIVRSLDTVKENPRHLIQALKGFILGLFLTTVFLTLRLAFLREIKSN